MELQSMWEKIQTQFELMATRAETGDATLELIAITAVSFILGFLFCYVQGKSND
uniref:Uncharacterized protein n=1 Tax=uncultured Thiotrichaceae bacterium TaxID=298394 RepID=A0A6S6S5D1_9GAMM|nr:MAG: Unknown protein [uncultured Thiotrichaceae bacterium]